MGWQNDEFSKECNVTTERVKTEEQNSKLKKMSGYKKPPDYVLYESATYNPIAIIEAKRQGQNVDDALEQAIEKYAIPLGVKIVFAYDGAFFKSWHIDYQRELHVDGEIITSLLTETKTLRFVNEGYSISEITRKVKHSRSELITIFKASNNLLRKEGLREGLERFNEFSNILFLKLVSEIEQDREDRGEKRIIDELFCWNQFSKKTAKEMHQYINDTVLRELRSQYGEIFDERLKIKPSTLKIIVDKLSKIDLMNTDSDVKGDAFEYFLKASITVGNDLGEYFTPRHIVKLMINLIEPKIGEKIYDPACGTGGFLISAFNYIKERTANKKGILKTLKEDTIYGNELTGTAKIAKMNMIITGDGHTNIEQKDSLEYPIEGKYDVVLSNPPYGQVTDFGNNYFIMSNNGDVVFIQHIVKSLSMGGRASIVIPEGVLFRPNDDYDLRKWLIQNTDIESIISLPFGVFRPYSKNKTDIITLRKDVRGTKSIWFYDLHADGFELNSDFRRAVDKNDIPHLLSNWNEKQETERSWKVSRKIVEENNYDLLPRTYKQVVYRNKNLEKLSTLLTPIHERITINSDQMYKQIRVKWYGGGGSSSWLVGR